MPKSGAGFTLIELLVVMTVIATLSTMVLFGLNLVQKNARDVQRQQIMKAVQGALQAHYRDKGKYPKTGSGGDVGWSYANCPSFVTAGYWSQGGFSGLTNLLTAAKYLNWPVIDPTLKKDITGRQDCGFSIDCIPPSTSNCEEGDIGKEASVWGDSSCGYRDKCTLGYNIPAGYHYWSDSASYRLVLVKESGGYQEFTSPK